MKIEICICDDDINIYNQLNSYFENFLFVTDYAFNITYCDSSDSILKTYEGKDKPFDLIFMDIELGSSYTGIDVSRVIRQKYDSNVNIVILTSYPEYMREGFEIHAYHYLHKPLDYSVFKNLMIDFTKSFGDQYSTVTLLDWEGTMSVIKLKEIVYIETARKFASKNYLLFHTINGTEDQKYNDYYASGNLSDWEMRLSENHFISPSRSLLVNLFHVKRFTKEKMELKDGNFLPISRRKFMDLKKKLSEYLFTGR